MNNSSIMERVKRALKQKLYLIDSSIINDFHRDFNIMGTTGNVYCVSVKSEPECTCPDHKINNNRCKHIYFILIRVMNVDINDADEEYFTDIELEAMFVKDISKKFNVSDSIKNMYDRYDKKSGTFGEVKKIFNDDDVCPICLDIMENNSSVVFCRYSCGRAIHKECFNHLNKHGKNSCVYCFKKWNVENNKKKTEYINLLTC